MNPSVTRRVAPQRPHAAATAGASSEAIDAVLVAFRVLVGVAAQSLADVGDRITLPHYRTLVILADRGPLGLGALAEHLGVHPSNATRQCDQLVAAKLIRRTASHRDRRAVKLALTPAGRAVVDHVAARRRAAIAHILESMTESQRQRLVAALHAFCAAVDETPPEQAWIVGWDT